MDDDSELLASLRAALSANRTGPPRGDLVVLRRDARRRRSTIYFVGVGDDTTPTMVVKRPSPEVERLGIRPPMTAEEQYAAVQRLHEFLAASDTPFAAPRGVALLPECGALAMEFVQGLPVSDLVRPSAIMRWHVLREALRISGLALRQLHAIEPAGSVVLDLADVESWAFSAARAALRGVETPARDDWFRCLPADAGIPGKVVLLHGDWAPENVMLGRDRVICLDPELTDRGLPEHDLARFVLMLLDRPLFVITGALGWSERRRDLVDTFLTAYYRGQAVSPLLRPLLVREVAQRWAVRHQEAQRGSAMARKARSVLLARYFGRVLDQISDPCWPGHAVGSRRPSADATSTPQP